MNKQWYLDSVANTEDTEFVDTLVQTAKGDEDISSLDAAYITIACINKYAELKGTEPQEIPMATMHIALAQATTQEEFTEAIKVFIRSVSKGMATMTNTAHYLETLILGAKLARSIGEPQGFDSLVTGPL